MQNDLKFTTSSLGREFLSTMFYLKLLLHINILPFHLNTTFVLLQCNETICALRTSYVVCTFNLHNLSVIGQEKPLHFGIFSRQSSDTEHFFSGLAHFSAWGRGVNNLAIFFVLGFLKNFSPSTCKSLAPYQQAHYVLFYFSRPKQK